MKQNKMRRMFLSGFCILLLASCATGPKTKHYAPSMVTHPPKIVAVLPPENLTSNTEIEEKLYPFISTRLAERGYYVIAPELLREIFLANKLEQAATINALSPEKFKEILGADAILITRVTDWSSKFFVVGSTVTVAMEMELLDTRTGKTLWKYQYSLSKTPNNNSSSLIGAIVSSALHAAVVPYEPIADENTQIIYATMPKGPFNSEWGLVK